jgi:hypothetical protein
MLIDKYNRLLIDKLPANIATEVEQIKAGTSNFTDAEMIDIYKSNFNDIFEIIQTKYPEALKPKKKLIVKTKAKLVKKAEPKRTLVKKKPSSKSKIDWEREAIDLLSEKLEITNSDAQGIFGAQKGMFDAAYKEGITAKRAVYKYLGKSEKEMMEDEFGKEFMESHDKGALKEYKEESDFDLSAIVGKKFAFYYEGDADPKLYTIKSAKVTDKKYDKRDVVISFGSSSERFPLSKLESFLQGEQIKISDYAIELQDAADEDCKTAIAEIKAIKTKKAQSAEARANAPKKKVSVAAREKQVKAAVSVFKTKAFKGNRKHAEGFAKDLVEVYKKHGLTTIADQLQKDIEELIEKHYKD